jgi:Protein of unknown function (DUF1194)/PEP-CTERM motif
MKIKNLVRVACLSTVAAFGLAATSANAATLELGLAIDGSGSMSVAQFNLQRDAYISVLSDISVLPRDGTTAIGVKVFSTGITTVFAMAEITAANHGDLITALMGMTRPGLQTNISGVINDFTTEIFSNGVTSTRQIIDVSTDGINNVGNLVTARSDALTAGIDQINCIGIGPSANCTPVTAGTGAFSLNAATFDDFRAALKKKILIEVRGVPEPGTWMMMIFGFGLAGTALRRQRRNAVAQLA